MEAAGVILVMDGSDWINVLPVRWREVDVKDFKEVRID